VSIYGFGNEALIPDMGNAKHLVLYGGNLTESLMVKEAKAFMAAVAGGMRVTYINPRASITDGESRTFPARTVVLSAAPHND